MKYSAMRALSAGTFALAVATAGSPAAAQQAETGTSARAMAPMSYRACFVPQVGAMYLLDLPGLPTQCLSATHQEIAWTDGTGPALLADSSVTTGALANDAVTNAKVADNAIGSAEVADNSLTATSTLR